MSDDNSQFKYILFDLDDTLYPREAGVMDVIIQRILLYMTQRLKFPPDDVSTKRHDFYQRYGTALRGLIEEHDIDPIDYLEFDHDFDPGDYLAASPPLDQMLTAIPLRKVVFTNADLYHGERVLATLRVRDHFDRIIDIRAMNFISKPDPVAYRQALALIEAVGPECIMVEDSPRNLIPAKDMGMVTILVGSESQSSAVDYVAPTIFHVERVLERVLQVGR